MILLYITWLYSVHFIGAIPNNINSIFSIVLIILPSLILIYLSKLFKDQFFKYNFNLKFFIAIFFNCNNFPVQLILIIVPLL